MIPPARAISTSSIRFDLSSTPYFGLGARRWERVNQLLNSTDISAFSPCHDHGCLHLLVVLDLHFEGAEVKVKPVVQVADWASAVQDLCDLFGLLEQFVDLNGVLIS